MDQRLAAAARRWQDEQPPPPEIPVRRLHLPLRRRPPQRRTVAAATAGVLLAGGALVVVAGLSRGGETAPSDLEPSPASRTHLAVKAVPFRDLTPTHPVLGRVANGARVTPYDGVSATGHFPETVRAGGTLAFDVVLESSVFLSLRPCPDYTITVGTLTTTRQLNCPQVPYFASLVRSTDHVTEFRPVLPAGTAVVFRMRVTAPDEPGPQRLLWTLEGPEKEPGFEGIVDVTPR